jgi:hypothetical protein
MQSPVQVPPLAEVGRFGLLSFRDRQKENSESSSVVVLSGNTGT